VFADDDPSSESTFEMDTLPPGLCEIGECAVVSVDQDGNRTIVTLRPAMLEFTTMVSGTTTDHARARQTLSNIGFTDAEIAASYAASATARGHLPARY
jgi:hypothetical protein